MPVAEIDLADVRTVLIASEKLAEPGLALDHYTAVLTTFEADPLEKDRQVPGLSKALDSLKTAQEDEALHPDRTPHEQALADLSDDDILLFPEAQRPAMKEAYDAARAQLKQGITKPAETPPVPSQDPTAALVGLLAQAEDALKKLRQLGVPDAALADIDRVLADPEMKQAMADLTPPRPEDIGPGKDSVGSQAH